MLLAPRQTAFCGRDAEPLTVRQVLRVVDVAHGRSSLSECRHIQDKALQVEVKPLVQLTLRSCRQCLHPQGAADQRFRGEPLMPGARPGLICSGDKPGSPCSTWTN